MEATEKRLAVQWRKLLGTRSGTLALAAGVAVLAGLVLVAFLAQYRDSVKGGAAPSTAMVAGGLIPKGTSGDVVITQDLYKPASVATDELKEGAIVDTQAIAGQVAVRDIYPGQQITVADFAAKADPVRGKLTGDQRALAVPIDAAHGLVGEIRSGDRVDVLAGFNAVDGRSGTGRPVLRTLMQNVLVLDAPVKEEGGGLGGGSAAPSVTVRVSDKQAAALAFAADNGKVWFALRPPTGGTAQAPSTVSMEALLAGSAPITAGGDR